jgi:hypothetical protein
VNHDARFKSLLRTDGILHDFFKAFLPGVEPFVDFDHIEFVDKERFTLEGKRRTGDLLVKTRFRGENAAFLIHLEHEAQARPDFARRMLEYFLLDWRDFDLPVYPVAVLSHPKRNPRCKSPLLLQIRDEEILSFRFAIIDLGGLKAREYARKPNAAAAALSSRMRIDPCERVDLAVDFLHTTTQAKLEEKARESAWTFFFFYQKFKGEEGLKLQKALSTMEGMKISKEILAHNPLVRFGMERGKSKGLRQGRRQEGTALVLRLLARRFGTLSSAQEKAIRKLPLMSIESLAEALLDFHSKTDLARWLKSNCE